MPVIYVEKKIVINRCFGGFSLSNQAAKELGIEPPDSSNFFKGAVPLPSHIGRDDPKLVEVVEKLGELANGKYSKLVVKEVVIPVEIEDYDGMESIRVGCQKY